VIRFADPGLKHPVKVPEGVGEFGGWYGCQAQPYDAVLPTGDRQMIVCRGFGPDPVRIYRIAPTVHYVLVYAVLGIRLTVAPPEYPDIVGLVLCKEQLWGSFAVQIMLRDRFLEHRIGMLCAEYGTSVRVDRFNYRFRPSIVPGPGVAIPQCRQHMDEGWVRPPVANADPDQQVLRCGLRVFHEDIKVSVIIKHAGVQQFILQFVAGAMLVGGYQVLIWIGSLRILV